MKLRFPLLASGLLLVAVPAAAQENVGLVGYHNYHSDPNDSLRDALVERFEQRMNETTVRYWETRLDGYKKSFDEIFGVQDLMELNELRVRFTLWIERMQEKEKEREERYKSEYGDYAYADTTATTTMTVDTVGYGIGATGDFSADTAYATPSYVEPTYTPEELEKLRAEEERQAEEWERQRKEKKAAEMAEMESKLARGEYVEEEDDDYMGMMTFMELPSISKWMAREYRSNLDVVGERILSDLHAFNDTLRAIIVDFEKRNAVDMAKVPDVRERLENKADFDFLAEMMPYPNTMRHFYVSRIEPWLLLYDGGGLSNFFSPVVQGASIAGDRPEVSIAEQNSPNPASHSTTITITLPESSSATKVHIFNTQGGEVLTLDQGALAVGNHSVVVDVSNLPSGSYLYQVRAQIASGEKVTSRIMQVMQ